MRRSYKLNVDTAKLLTSSTITKTTSTSTTSSSSTTTSPASTTITEDRRTTAKTSSSSTIRSNQNHISEKISTLLEDVGTSKEEKISRGIMFAMLGSLVLFIGVIVIIVFNKPSAKKPLPVEKEELIENEVQPHRSLHV